MVERDTFKYKITEMSLTNAKTKQEAAAHKSKNNSKKATSNSYKNNDDDFKLPGPKYDDIQPIEENPDEGS